MAKGASESNQTSDCASGVNKVVQREAFAAHFIFFINSTILA
jgi:hypothetical protein